MKYVDKTVAAHQESIQLMDEISGVFQRLKSEIEVYERKMNVAKTAGTIFGAAGATFGLIGILSAAATGNSSAFLMLGAVGVIAGAVANSAVNFVDHLRTKEFFRRINEQMERYNNQLRRLDDLRKEVNVVVEESIKQHDVEASTSLFVIQNTKENWGKAISLISSTTNGAMLLQAARVIDRLASFGKLIRTPTGGLQFTLKKTDLNSEEAESLVNFKAAASEAIRFAPNSSEPWVQGVVSVAALFVALWEVKNLVDSWTQSHPTIQAVDKVINELDKKRNNLQHTLDEILRTKSDLLHK